MTVDYQKRFEWCRGSKYPMAFDFVIEDLKLMIENQGRQHYMSNAIFCNLEQTEKHDMIKIEKALDHGYTMIHILQEDVLADKHDWAEKLSAFLVKQSSPIALTIKTSSPIK